MSKRIKDCKHILKAIYNSKGAEQKGIIDAIGINTVKAICDCGLNILRRRVSISNKQRNKLKHKREVLRALVLRRVPIHKKKELIVQEGGGFLLPLLAPVLAALLGKVL